MKSKVICHAALLMTLIFGSTAWGAQMPQAINNDKELKAALRAAKTPEDDLRIAAYCKARAEWLNSEAEGYEEAATALRNSPYVKNLMSPSTPGRYEYIAKSFREEAQANRELAATHEQMAKNVTPASK